MTANKDNLKLRAEAMMKNYGIGLRDVQDQLRNKFGVRDIGISHHPSLTRLNLMIPYNVNKHNPKVYTPIKGMFGVYDVNDELVRMAVNLVGRFIDRSAKFYRVNSLRDGRVIEFR